MFQHWSPQGTLFDWLVCQQHQSVVSSAHSCDFLSNTLTNHKNSAWKAQKLWRTVRSMNLYFIVYCVLWTERAGLVRLLICIYVLIWMICGWSKCWVSITNKYTQTKEQLQQSTSGSKKTAVFWIDSDNLFKKTADTSLDTCHFLSVPVDAYCKLSITENSYPQNYSLKSDTLRVLL